MALAFRQSVGASSVVCIGTASSKRTTYPKSQNGEKAGILGEKAGILNLVLLPMLLDNTWLFAFIASPQSLTRFAVCVS